MDSSEATARMKSSQVKEGSMHSVTLARMVSNLLHTPVADGLKKRTKGGQRRMMEKDFEEMFPENAGSQDSKDGRASQLNPLFVGEMMGYPLAWLISPFLSGNGERRP